MQILFFENVFGWTMTGLLGKNSAWFLGFSKQPRIDNDSVSDNGIVSVHPRAAIQLLKDNGVLARARRFMRFTAPKYSNPTVEETRHEL